MPRYNEQAQKLILNVAEFFQKEKERLQRGENIVAAGNVAFRASLALGVSEPVIYKTRQMGIRNDEEWRTKMANSVQAAKTRMTDYIRDYVREVIYKMYDAKDYVTVKSLHARLKEEMGADFDFSQSALWKCCKDIGFNWKMSCERKYLMEQPHIQLKRQEFLRGYIKNKHSQISLMPVFLDETWIFSKGSQRKSWQDGSMRTSSKRCGDGVRYIVVHAGNSEGFIPNAALVFKSHAKKGDYHDSMNRENFERWFKTQFVPNLKTPSLIIMDNATYHSGLAEEIPVKSWTKKRLIEWLIKNKTDFPENALKCDIWAIVAPLRKQKKYHLDEYVKEFGHRIQRLPPYHCHFNAIEMVWSEAKRKYDVQIFKTASSPDEILNTWNQVLSEIGPDKWAKYVHHIEKNICQAWELEKKWDASDTSPLIININGPVSDSDTDDSVSSSYDEF